MRFLSLKTSCLLFILAGVELTNGSGFDVNPGHIRTNPMDELRRIKRTVPVVDRSAIFPYPESFDVSPMFNKFVHAIDECNALKARLDPKTSEWKAVDIALIGYQLDLMTLNDFTRAVGLDEDEKLQLLVQFKVEFKKIEIPDHVVGYEVVKMRKQHLISQFEEKLGSFMDNPTVENSIFEQFKRELKELKEYNDDEYEKKQLPIIRKEVEQALDNPRLKERLLEEIGKEEARITGKHTVNPADQSGGSMLARLGNLLRRK